MYFLGRGCFNEKTASFILVLSLLLAFIIPAEGGLAAEGNLLFNRALNWEAPKDGILTESVPLRRSVRKRTAEIIAFLLRTGLRIGTVWPRTCLTS